MIKLICGIIALAIYVACCSAMSFMGKDVSWSKEFDDELENLGEDE